jgi:hypothetical protein
MSDTRIIKNKPKLNSYGQYKFNPNSTGINDADNLSLSGEFNTKFLDDDLYTINLSNDLNEDVLNNRYNLQQLSSFRLSVNVKSNKVNYRVRDIKIKVALDSIASNSDYMPTKLFDNGGGCDDVDLSGLIYAKEDFGVQDEKYNPPQSFSDATIFTGIGSSNATYNENFDSYANTPEGDLLQKLKLDYDGWNGIKYGDTDIIRVGIFMHGNAQRKTAGGYIKWHEDRKPHTGVYFIPLSDLKYDDNNGNCNEILDSGDDSIIDNYDSETGLHNDGDYLNCVYQGDDNHYKKLRTTNYQNSTLIAQYEDSFYIDGDVSECFPFDSPQLSPAFKLESVNIDILPPYQLDVNTYNEVTDEYEEIIQNSLTLSPGGYDNWFNFSPLRVVNIESLDGENLNNIYKDFVIQTNITSNINLQQYYEKLNEKFMSSAPTIVELSFDVKQITQPLNELVDINNGDLKIGYALFVIDWNDRDDIFKTWEDVVGEDENIFPSSYTDFINRQNSKNTFILSGVDNDNLYNNDNFSNSTPLQHFYNTSGLKTIKAVAFSYYENSSGQIQAIRWKLITSRIFLNENRVTEQDFSEVGTIGFTTIPWPYTTPIISGISKLSKYYDSVENTLYNNRFASDELLSETQVYNSLINDELGDFIGDVDIEQTRFFSGAYDMDQLLMVEEDDGVGSFTPYTNDDYWDAENNFYPDFDESCVGLIFISDSSNTDLKRDCLIELNMGDVEDIDSIADTSGNKNIGLLIGDYTIKKESTSVPLTRDSEMKLPETDNTDKAI